MKRDDACYQSYVQILKEELVPAMGCTEPIAIAFAGACARKALQCLPTQVSIYVSNNIIKNVKSVVVPNTGGQKGIKAAAAAGIVAGEAEKVLEVISNVSQQQQQEIATFINACPMDVRSIESEKIFDILLEVKAGGDTVRVRISDFHTNVLYVEKNGTILYQGKQNGNVQANTERNLLIVKDILNFAETLEIEDVKQVIDRQIAYNTAIAQEGMRCNYGANIGKTLLAVYGNDVMIRAKAMAAAGSDARMSGCELPVVINSGSGNQGITASVPVLEYAQELRVSYEKTVRALVLSNLLTIHLKTGIGRLSAYCGAVSAGCSAGAAIAYLNGGDFKMIAHTLVNSLAIVSGIICDGAKPSCAAKIAYAVDAGILGWKMYTNGQQFFDGDGIVRKGVENTIKNVSRLGNTGMKQTDEEIIRMMTEA